MNGAHWHLAFSHLPIIIPIVGILIMIGGILIRSNILKLAAYCIFILGALTAIVALSTGEGAEEVVEKIGGIDEQLIKVHEEVAEIFASLLSILGVFSLIGLWASWNEKSFANYIAYSALLIALVSLYYAKQTGTTGGEIRHTEIRAGNSPAVNATDDDDDNE